MKLMIEYAPTAVAFARVRISGTGLHHRALPVFIVLFPTRAPVYYGSASGSMTTNLVPFEWSPGMRSSTQARPP